ncbi:MAG TPA: hypothetical protein VEO19_05775 [Terriglobia bacterium]|nr:hypothetical protein [Terriglobia bacterium]
MWGQIRAGVAVLICLLFAGIPARAAEQKDQPPAPCVVEPTRFQGWDAERMANRWVTLIFVPKLGGRLMQVTFGSHEYLFVNPLYLGKYFPPSQGAGEGKWFNYGGDKIWPLPEGTQDEQHWAGGSDVLDDGIYQLGVLSTGKVCTIRMQGPPDERTGLEYSREISISADSPRIAFHAVMQNITGHRIRWSVQSVTQYNTAAPGDPGNYNRNFWAFTPANPASAFNRRFDAHAGPIDHPSYGIQSNSLFALHWSYLEGEVGVDSTAGWVAVVDGLSSFAMVERSRFFPGADYPERASVIFYIDGPTLNLNGKGMPEISRTKLEDAPYYMEAELNSPLVTLAPEGSYAFDSEWFPTRMTPHLVDVTDAGMVGRELAALPVGSGLRLTGFFGVFYAGRLLAHLYDARGVALKTQEVTNADPLEAVSLDATIPAPLETDRVSLHLLDERGLDRGSLGEVEVVKGSR